MTLERIQIGLDVTYAPFRRGGIDEYQYQLASRLAGRQHPGFAFSNYTNYAPFRVRNLPDRPDCTLMRKWRMFQNWQLAKHPECWIYKKYPCDLIHMSSHLFMPFGKKKLATIHDVSFLYEDCCMNEVFDFRRHAELMAMQCEHFIAVSAFAREELCRHLHVPDHKVSVVHEGVRECFFERESKERLRAVTGKYGLRDPYVLFVGVLSKRKNVPVVLRAMELDWPENIDFVIAGKNGNDASAVQAMIESSSRKNQIKRIHFVPENDLSALYQGAFAYCLPSLQEGFGFTLLEAMASGVPVVAAANSAIVETAGKSALFFDTQDEGQLVERIKELEAGRRRSEMIELGHARAREFSWAKCVDQTLQVYERMI